MWWLVLRGDKQLCSPRYSFFKNNCNMRRQWEHLKSIANHHQQTYKHDKHMLFKVDILLQQQLLMKEIWQRQHSSTTTAKTALIHENQAPTLHGNPFQVANHSLKVHCWLLNCPLGSERHWLIIWNPNVNQMIENTCLPTTLWKIFACLLFVAAGSLMHPLPLKNSLTQLLRCCHLMLVTRHLCFSTWVRVIS